MTDAEKEQALQEKLMYYLKGNFAAVQFCMYVVFVAHLWDDLIDQDNVRSEADINNAFMIALVEIPSNPFYMANVNELRPIMRNTIMQWLDANKLERGTDHDKHMAFMLRSSICQIFNYCAYLVGGPEWANEVGPHMRRLYEEPLEDFMKEFENA